MKSHKFSHIRPYTNLKLSSLVTLPAMQSELPSDSIAARVLYASTMACQLTNVEKRHVHEKSEIQASLLS